MKITRKSVCKTHLFFCHSLAYILICLRTRCLQAIPNWLIFCGPRPLEPPMRVPNEWLALQLPISLCGWVAPTIKSLKQCRKHIHIKNVLKNVHGPHGVSIVPLGLVACMISHSSFVELPCVNVMCLTLRALDPDFDHSLYF